MSNVLFLADQWSNISTFAQGTSGSDGGVTSNANDMLLYDPRKFWFSNSNTNATFEFSRTQNTPLTDTVYVGYTHLGAAGTWRIRGWTPPQTSSSPEFDTGVMTFHPNADLTGFEFISAIHRLSAPVLVTNIQVDLTDDGSSGQPIQVGIFRAGEAFVPTVNVQKEGYAIGPANNSEIIETFGGTPRVRTRPSYHTLDLSMENQIEVDKHEYIKVADWYAGRIPIVVALDYAGDWMTYPSDGMIYALLEFESPPARAASSGMLRRWDVSITGREFI